MNVPRSFAEIFRRHGNGEAPPARLVELIANSVLMSRQNLLRGAVADPRRDVDAECGHPKTSQIDIALYQDLYERSEVANRVIHLWPRECFAVQPTVYEDESPDSITPFEEAWDALGRQLRGEQSWYRDEEGSPVWEAMRTADELAGIGRYAVMFLGLDDSLPLYLPAKGFTEQGSVPMGKGDAAQPDDWTPPRYSFSVNASRTANRRLLYMRPIPESLASITRWEANYGSPRFGMPTEYEITLGDPAAGYSGSSLAARSYRVHWSRIVHLVDNPISGSRTFGTPRLQPVLNRVLDLKKLYGGSAEMFWLGALAVWVFESHPNPTDADVEIDSQGLKDQWEQVLNGLQRILATTGGSLKSLAPNVVNPTPQIAAQLQAIAIQLDVPLRIFMGSERGQMASGQDKKEWDKRVSSRQVYHTTPRVIVPVVDRLIALGVLPQPRGSGKVTSGTAKGVLDADGNPSPLELASGYSVWWPDVASLSEQERSTIAVQVTQAVVQYRQSGAEDILTQMDFWTGVIGKSEAEAKSIVDNAAKEKKARDEQAANEAAANPPATQPVNPPIPPDPGANHIAGRANAT